MNVNEEDFQKRLDEIGKLYEHGKNAIYATHDFMIGSIDSTKALICLKELRDIAAVSVRQAYQLKEN